MKIVIGSYILDNVSSTAYEEFITYYQTTPASYITNNDIERWNTPADLSEYATVSYVTDNFIEIEKSIASAMSYVNDKVDNIDIPEQDLSDYVTYSYLQDKNYLTEHQDLSSYATISYVTDKFREDESVWAAALNNLNTQLGSYVTNESLSQMGYITLNDIPEQTVDLSSYTTVSYVTGEIVKTEKAIASAVSYISDKVDSAISYVNSKVDSIEIPETQTIDLSSYATQSYVMDKINDLGVPGIIRKNSGNWSIYTTPELSNKNFQNVKFKSMVFSDPGFSPLYCGEYSVLFGQYNESSYNTGKFNIMAGSSNYCDKSYSGVLGYSNAAMNNYNFITGKYNKTYNLFETGFGSYNNSIINRTLFSVGYGTSKSNRYNAFELTQNGFAYITYNNSNEFCLQDFITYTYNNIGGTEPDLSSYATISYVSENLIEVEKAVASAVSYVNSKVDNIDLSSYALKSELPFVCYNGGYILSYSYNNRPTDSWDVREGGVVIYKHSTNYNSIAYAGAVAIGDRVSARGEHSLAIGNQAQTSAQWAIASGFASQARGQSSIALGQYVKTYDTGSAAIGAFNNATQGVSLFTVGDGKANDARHNALEITLNGYSYISKPCISYNSGWSEISYETWSFTLQDDSVVTKKILMF